MDTRALDTRSVRQGSWFRRWGFLVLLLVVVAASAAFRFHELGRRAIWFDEGATLGVVRLPFGESLRNIWSTGLSNQVFYYLALRPWHLLGEAEATLRAFSAIFSVGAVALVCVLGRRLFGAAAGLAAGVVLGLHYFAIRYAQEARGYGLATFLVCLAALFLDLFIQQGRRRDLVGWTVVSVLALYAHFFALFTVAAQVLSILANGPQELKQRKALLAGLAGIALFAVPIVLELAGAPRDWLHWVPPVDARRVAEVGSCLAGGKSYLLLFYLALFAALLPGAFRDSRPVRRWGTTLVVSWAAFPVLAMAAISLWIPILIERYVSMSVPAWALAVGAVVGPLIERKRLAALGFALLGFVLVSEVHTVGFVYHDQFEDCRTAAAEVAAATRPGDAILYDQPEGGLAFGYYLDRAPHKPEPLQGSLVFPEPFDAAEAMRRERVWLVCYHEDPATVARIHQALIQTHSMVRRVDYGSQLRVFLYERNPRENGEGASEGQVR